MAIVKFGTVVVGVRGTVGGLTFTAGLSGPYVRAWAKGANPRTGSQSTVRARLSSMGESWRNLTSGQRDDWDDYAAAAGQEKTNSLGESYYASGFNWFSALSCNLLQGGEDLIEDAPTGSVPAAAAITDFVFEEVMGSPDIHVEYGVGEFASDEAIVVDAAYVPTGGRKVEYSGYYNMGVEYDPGASPWGFDAAFISKFGVPREGDQAFIRVWKQSDEGRRGPIFTAVTVYS